MFSDDKPSLHLKTNVFLYLVKFFLLSMNCSTEIIQFLETVSCCNHFFDNYILHEIEFALTFAIQTVGNHVLHFISKLLLQ